jgi:hypothetical protein
LSAAVAVVDDDGMRAFVARLVQLATGTLSISSFYGFRLMFVAAGSDASLLRKQRILPAKTVVRLPW